MDETATRSDFLLNDRNESSNIVLGDLLALQNGFGIKRCFSLNLFEVLGRNFAEFFPGLTSEDFDVEPGLQECFLRPNGCHLRATITIDQISTPVAAWYIRSNASNKMNPA